MRKKDLKTKLENENQVVIGSIKYKSCNKSFQTEVECNEYISASHAENSDSGKFKVFG